MATEASSSTTAPLGKYLASTDKKTRDKAVKNLAAFLSDPSRDVLPKTEISKLWKGIFYCFWMSDKPLVQQALASELAEIVLNIESVPSALAFLRGFWEAMVREWSSIDRLRIDKYYMLVRRFVNAAFRLLIREDWERATFEAYTSILADKGGPLCPEDIRVPTSLSYHLADIYLEELDKAFANAPVDSPLPAPLSALLSPFFTLTARTPVNITYQRIQSSLLGPIFGALSPPRETDEPIRKRPRLSTLEYPHLLPNACAEDPKTEGALDRASLKKVLLKKVFDVASEQDTRDANRRKLYALWKEHTEDEDSGGDQSDDER
ncbi:hypothetical protein CERSUDRAFT_42980 [Gelatoporia subvermispora B]|uniref:Nop52-domain-containing protein n=1 Tax=Ceriporiopsis subvermispora (strain B) TaxID=914234 RepID=M2RSD4_CERS8|nr:hypothetical protein CERSUDRAFT_42980 [Gelatoporia subvermispora B]